MGEGVGRTLDDVNTERHTGLERCAALYLYATSVALPPYQPRLHSSLSQSTPLLEARAMPTIRCTRTAIARVTRLFATVAFVVVPMAARAQDFPSKLTESSFWKMVTEFSEAGGSFRSDNFVSNEGNLRDRMGQDGNARTRPEHAGTTAIGQFEKANGLKIVG